MPTLRNRTIAIVAALSTYLFWFEYLPPFKRVHLHEIKDEPHLATLDYASKSKTDWPFLLQLRDFGREAAGNWLERYLADVGTKATADMHAMLHCLETH